MKNSTVTRDTVEAVKTSIDIKRETLDLISVLLERLATEERDLTRTYKPVAKSDKQKTHWRTGELMWEDEEQTIPVYEDIYDYVDKTDDEYSPSEKARLTAVKSLSEALIKLI